MPASVPSKSRNSALRAGSAASGWSSAGRRAAAPPRRHPRRARSGTGCRDVVLEARSWPMTTTTSMPVAFRSTGRRGRQRQHLCRLHPDGGGDRRRRLLHARRVVDGRGRLRRRRVDGCLHRPSAGADDRGVVRGQARWCSSRWPRRRSPCSARPSWSSSARRGVPPWSWWWSKRRAAPAAVVEVVLPASAAAVVVVVDVGLAVLLTLGRVPTATRTATATTKSEMTATALTTESEPEVPCAGWSPSIAGPACRATRARCKPFRW